MWVCTTCGTRVDHSLSVCGNCGTNQAGEREASVTPAVLASPARSERGLAYFILTVAATLSAAGCVGSVFMGLGALIASNWPVALILAPLCFVFSAAMTIVFVRVRDWRPAQKTGLWRGSWGPTERGFHLAEGIGNRAARPIDYIR